MSHERRPTDQPISFYCLLPQAVKNFGVKLGIEMCERLTSMGFKWLHFYTLNLERSVRLILNGVGYASKATLRRQFPWRASTDIRRAREDVRPINWSNCPKSYLQRTHVWDEFPNGVCGDEHILLFFFYFKNIVTFTFFLILFLIHF